MKQRSILKLLLSLLVLPCMLYMITIYQPDIFLFDDITYQVSVVNGLSNNSSLPLVIWCNNVDDAYSDIGGRALQEGDDFSWNVRVTLWKYISSTNVFSCTMKWDQKRKKFEAFWLRRDESRCGVLRKCVWLVKEDGFYFSNDESNWVREFTWP
ncbi:Plant self-incompatibility S1 [Artemisia annua]|uniref:Plant self-incompatibility S1 n=1 Tax=Artemisia annua TaxID=35608 RepID=A0A2U1Q2H3_ARTAN|nr:Plant self-incompatibility S1 [Artemisia annua]